MKSPMNANSVEGVSAKQEVCRDINLFTQATNLMNANNVESVSTKQEL